MQRQHRRERFAVVGDKQAPALIHLERDTRAQLRQQEIACRFETGRSPAVHPDAGDLVIFVGAGGTDRWLRDSSVLESNVAVSGAKRRSLRDNIAMAPFTSPMAVGSLRGLQPLRHFL